MRVLFFIGSLRTGGKERRLIELITWLKNRQDYKVLVVVAFNKIEYPAFYSFEIDYIVLNKKQNFKDPRVFIQLYKICKRFKPDIIHSWGSMETFYVIPASKLLKIPLVNSQITDAPPQRTNSVFTASINWFNFTFSNIILSNSKAGLDSYGFKKNKKCKVIYNGFNQERIQYLPIKIICKKNFNIESNYAVVMVGSFSENKDYQRYIDVCRLVTDKRNDITFIAAGDGKYLKTIKDRATKLGIRSLIFTGRITNVEELIKACDIGVLFSPNGEGISNAIIEYMALEKPVIAYDIGGTKEIVSHNISGYLINYDRNQVIADMIIDLIDNPQKRIQFGQKGKKIVLEKFSLEKMGREFEVLYSELV